MTTIRMGSEIVAVLVTLATTTVLVRTGWRYAINAARWGAWVMAAAALLGCVGSVAPSWGGTGLIRGGVVLWCGGMLLWVVTPPPHHSTVLRLLADTHLVVLICFFALQVLAPMLTTSAAPPLDVVALAAVIATVGVGWWYLAAHCRATRLACASLLVQVGALTLLASGHRSASVGSGALVLFSQVLGAGAVWDAARSAQHGASAADPLTHWMTPLGSSTPTLFPRRTLYPLVGARLVLVASSIWVLGVTANWSTLVWVGAALFVRDAAVSSEQHAIIADHQRMEVQQTRNTRAVRAAIANSVQTMLLHNTLLDRSAQALDPTTSTHIRAHVTQLRRLLEQLRVYLWVGRYQCHAVLVALLDTCQSSVGVYATETQRRQVTVTLGGDPRIQVWTDPHLLQRVVDNLVSNAVAATPDGGTITLRVHPAPYGAWITIADTGNGLPEDQGVRLDAAPSDPHHSGKRHGLGLSIVRECLGLLNGHAVVASTMQGTAIQVWVPCQASGTAHAPPAGHR